MKFRVFRDRVDYVYANLPPYTEVFQKADIEQDEAPAVTYHILRSIIEWIASCLKAGNRDSAELVIWDRENREGGWTIQAKILPEKSQCQTTLTESAH